MARTTEKKGLHSTHYLHVVKAIEFPLCVNYINLILIQNQRGGQLYKAFHLGQHSLVRVFEYFSHFKDF
jgi:hypothetical protein